MGVLTTAVLVVRVPDSQPLTIGCPDFAGPPSATWSGGTAHGAILTFYILTENFQPLLTEGLDNLTIENIFVVTVPGAPSGVSAI